MRYSIVGFLIFILSGTVFAQTTVPHTFTAGTAAQASEVNANFAALVAAINALESVNTPLTAADVAGTYQLLAIASMTGSLATTKKAASASETNNGTLTFNVNGNFTGVITSRSNEFNVKGQDCVNSATSTDIAFPGLNTQHAHGYSASLCNQDSTVFLSQAVNDLNQAISGTWALNAGTSTITVTPAAESALLVYISKRGGVGFAVEVSDNTNASTPGRRFGLSVLVKQ